LLSTVAGDLYEEFPREEFGTAMAIFGVGVMVGPTLGPTVGGWITDMYGWPRIFYIKHPVRHARPGAHAVVHHRLGAPAEGGSRRLAGLGLLAAGVGALQIMLERRQRSTGLRRIGAPGSRSRARFR